ncbi:hypothetical protein GQX74_009687 [Glossina fuscipes]|nr:hypothetical protein GQX74_009687 [Glossina fuscipes]
MLLELGSHLMVAAKIASGVVFGFTENSILRKQLAGYQYGEIVRNDRTLEQIVFPIPEICEYLSTDDQGSKVADFFDKSEDMFNEMKWQKKLRGQPFLFWVSSYMSLWSNILFNCVVVINMIVAFFHPLDNTVAELSSHISLLLWAILSFSLVIVATLPRESGIRTLIGSIILRSIFLMGPESTLCLLGIVTVSLKSVHIISIMGNQGTLEKHFFKIITDFQLLRFLMWFMLIMLINVIRSVTRNGRSIVLTTVLALILVYLFSIIKDDFLVSVDVEDAEYKTAYAEDNAYLSTFNYASPGFVKQPTDYYFRPLAFANLACP